MDRWGWSSSTGWEVGIHSVADTRLDRDERDKSLKCPAGSAEDLGQTMRAMQRPQQRIDPSTI